jgi:glutamate racemase
MYRLYNVDAILITCSTMNRSAEAVRRVMQPYGIPVVQIDEAMMERAVERGGRILVVATHGPTVKSTQDLLQETSERLGKQIDFAGATVEKAFHLLGDGDIQGHNEAIASAIREARSKEGDFQTIVLAQLSMSVFKFSCPEGNAEREFGAPVLTSGETGFQRVREVLLQQGR